MHAVVLAGGFGKRLQVACPDVPKPMAPIAGKPFLAYLLDYLILQGFSSVTLSVFYLADKIQQYFQDYYTLSNVSGNDHGLTITYVYETQPLGTGGALRQALAQVPIKSKPIWMMNGDSILTLDFAAMLQTHQMQKSRFTMALCQVADCSRYGKVQIEHNRVIAFQEKGEFGVGLINAGIYLTDADLFTNADLLDPFSFESDFLQPQLNKIKPVIYVSDGYFIDIGIPADYQRAQIELPHYIQAIQAAS